MEERNSMLMVIIIWVFLVCLLWCSKSNAECLKNDNIQQIVDISSDRTWTIVCETSSKLEADIALEQQKVDNCWVGKESNEEIYRVFCPVIFVESN